MLCAMDPEQDPEWKSPELIALVRSTAEEAMLSPCRCSDVMILQNFFKRNCQMSQCEACFE